MKTINDPAHALDQGLAAIRAQFHVPGDFSPAVLAAAEEAAKRPFTDHVDRRSLDFRTLDPATSTDLDQAFAIEVAGADILLHYAIADVAWFVDDDGPIDREAWARGETIYLPDGKASLYPPVLSEGAASLLPAADRPAIVMHVRIAPDGGATMDSVERAIIHSRAKLAYDSVGAADLPAGFEDLSQRIAAAEAARGAARVDPPQQLVSPVAGGGWLLDFEPRLKSEDDNAAMSLAANLAAAALLQAHHTGLFRVMPAPGHRATSRLRHSAKALALDWPSNLSLDQYSRTLSATDPKQAAFMLEIRRASLGATYQPYHDGVVPWHAAMAATYVHATAPLRRLADRYVLRGLLAVANGQPVPDVVSAAYQKLPEVMARADQLASTVDRAAIDLAEAVMLQPRVGEKFAAVVTDIDERGARIMLTDMPVIARVAASGVTPGDAIQVTLASADPATRQVGFTPAS